MNMDISENGGAEDRIVALERKVTELEALVKGLTDELLDFKAITRDLARRHVEYRAPETVQEPAGSDTLSSVPDNQPASPGIAARSGSTTVIRPKTARQPEVPAAPSEPEMVRIMQSDGTMKLEPRRGDTRLRH
jgi:hypothetical protein